MIMSRSFGGAQTRAVFDLETRDVSKLETDLLPKRSEQCLYRQLHFKLKETEPNITFFEVKARFMEYFFTKLHRKVITKTVKGNSFTFLSLNLNALGEIGVRAIKCD